METLFTEEQYKEIIKNFETCMPRLDWGRFKEKLEAKDFKALYLIVVEEGIRQAEACGACEGNLSKAKEFLASGDWEAMHRLTRGVQGWLVMKGVLPETIYLHGDAEAYEKNGEKMFSGKLVGKDFISSKTKKNKYDTL